jgi:hypothetical protein
LIPEGVTTIGYDAFYGCRELKSITISNSVTTISNGAFQLCDNLTTVSIGNGVTSFGKDVFAYCGKLNSITITCAVPARIGEDVFGAVPLSKATLHVPAEYIDSYKSKWPWSYFGSIVAIKE